MTPTPNSKTWATQIDGPHSPTMSPEAAEVISSAKGECRWDFFFRTESNHHSVDDDANRRSISVTLPADLSLRDALAIAIVSTPVPIGSYRTGVHEVQNDLGIYQQTNGRRFSFTTARRAATTTFRTWDELEAEEVSNV